MSIRSLTRLQPAASSISSIRPRFAAGGNRLLLPSRKWQSSNSAGGASDYQLGPANDLQPQPSTQFLGSETGGAGRKGKDGKKDGGGGGGEGGGPGTSWKMFESAATTGASLTVLGLAGYAYHKYYKHLVLQKIDNAFNEGDPALNLANASKRPGEPWYAFWTWGIGGEEYVKDTHPEVDAFVPIMLEEQDKIDRIVAGHGAGHYYLLIGEKGTGKTSMLLTAMHKTLGEGCSMMEAHADPEIFRLRLGKALDFEFHEDYIGSLFSIRGPRETTALLDIERAFNKLEKVALQRRIKTGKPLIMIINGMHMVHDDEVGRDLVELLQQRAESWAAAGLVTMIFNSDDYWVYERMKQYGSRMELISVRDLTRQKALEALRVLRKRHFPNIKDEEETLSKVYERVGGRLAFLSKVAKVEDMLEKCEEIYQTERTWLLNKCWILGEGMDDDVMDQQKFASSAMMLVKALADMDKEGEGGYDPEHGHKLPEVPLHLAREIMTRADFIQQYDHDNIFTIDSKAKVRADSVPMMHAFREICAEPGFADYLEETMNRIGDIESLGRTREVTLKDLWNGGKYQIKTTDAKGRHEKTVVFDVTRGHKGVHGDEGDSEEDEEKK